MAGRLKCTLPGCDYSTDAGQGYAAHQRAHVIRGEAKWENGDHKTLVSTGLPIVTEPYERKKRMDAIKNGAVHADVRLPSKKYKKNTTALAKPRPSTEVDLSKYSAEQVASLRRQLGVVDPTQVEVGDHSCVTTRAVDRLKQAVVLASVSEMLDDADPDQLLLMMSQMRRMPPLPRRG